MHGDHLSFLQFKCYQSCNCPHFSAGPLTCTRTTEGDEASKVKHRNSDHKSTTNKCMGNIELASNLALTSGSDGDNSKGAEDLKTNISGGKKQPWICHSYQKSHGKSTTAKVRLTDRLPTSHRSCLIASPIDRPCQPMHLFVTLTDRSALSLTDRSAPHRSVSRRLTDPALCPARSICPAPH